MHFAVSCSRHFDAVSSQANSRATVHFASASQVQRLISQRRKYIEDSTFHLETRVPAHYLHWAASPLRDTLIRL